MLALPRILFLPRFTSKGPSSRYRIWQYLPWFDRAGYQVEVEPLLPDEYVDELYRSGRRAWGATLRGYSRRIIGARKLRDFDVVICEQELLPYFPAWSESLFHTANCRLILDYDDAAYVKYAKLPGLRNKIGRLMSPSAAAAVVVGNTHLANYARQFNSRVHIISTVVNPPIVDRSANRAGSNHVRIVWIGSPSTAKLLGQIVPAMQRLQARHPEVSFRIIGSGAGAGVWTGANGLRLETLPWSEESEYQMISECDIGIMPTWDDEFTRGKCALKLVQYMACGLPVIASPIGASTEIVEDGLNGFLASGQQQWLEKLEFLVSNPAQRQRMGEAGRKKFLAEYTIEQGFLKWDQVLKSLGAE